MAFVVRLITLNRLVHQEKIRNILLADNARLQKHLDSLINTAYE